MFQPIPFYYPGEASSSCYCGLTLDGKLLEWIVGGTEADKHEYPWQVGFVEKGETDIWCGGSLISDSWVLTAAHCPQAAYGHGAESIQVRGQLHPQHLLTRSLLTGLAGTPRHFTAGCSQDYQK